MMNFVMNDRKWEVRETSQKTILSWAELKAEEGVKLHGLCVPGYQTILIWEDQCEQQKIQTLRHELMHAYIHSYAVSLETYSEDELCELSANAAEIINKIVFDFLIEGEKTYESI